MAQAPDILFSNASQYFSATVPNGERRISAVQLPAHILRDQRTIWTSPWNLQKSDLFWLFPLAATTSLLIGTDHHEMTLIHSNLKTQANASRLANVGLAAFAGATALAFGLGRLNGNEHVTETGLLSTEALADTFAVTEAMKFAFSRERPDVASAKGLFGHASPLDSSFPSAHAALAWSAASVFAHEYPGSVSRAAAYGLASLVSVSQIIAERHFPSDVLIGGVTGYLIGKFVYKTHHDNRLNDRTGTAILPNSGAPRRQSSDKRASPYVPLDSWIYPALRRLAALGYVKSQSSDLAPWSRLECLLQTEEAAGTAGTRASTRNQHSASQEALRLIAGLRKELGSDATAQHLLRLESVYSRTSFISGTPLRDSYHFGQSITDDYGRPYDKGFNNYTGFSGSATAGPVFAYFRGEYQYAPGRTADSLNIREFVANSDATPLQLPRAVAPTSRFDPLEMYAGLRLGFENITFGKQGLYWGPGEESAFSFSINAEPIYMLRLAQATPLVLPGIFSHLGKIRTALVVGKLSGHQWPARPYINAQKISLDITDSFELGFTRSAIFGGVGHPLTLGNLDANFFSVASTGAGGYGARSDPGDRHSGFDFRYRVPGLRRYLTVYSDSYADDEPNPIDNPKRSAWGPGLYLSRIPRMKRLDFRFETYSTLLYRKDPGGNFLYWNTDYRDAYTNNGYLLGSWIGRDSRAYVASTTYWFSAQSKLQTKYRQIKAGNQFLPGGGTQTDWSESAQLRVTPEWSISATAQYERYNLPILGPATRDLMGSLQIAFTPKH